MHPNKIVITDGANYEVWGSIKEICKVKNLPYNYLKRLKFPFVYKKVLFVKVEFRKENGVKFK